MSNPTAPFNEHLPSVRSALLWAMAALVFLGVFYFVVERVERFVARWPHGGSAAISPTHCAEFIAIAKAAYGESWKVRLDPSDTTCAAEVQAAWEQQRVTRAAEELARQPAEVVSVPPPVATAPVETPAAAAPTYCLNVISLAKAKHGADWALHLDPAQRAACGTDVSLR